MDEDFQFDLGAVGNASDFLQFSSRAKTTRRGPFVRVGLLRRGCDGHEAAGVESQGREYSLARKNIPGSCTISASTFKSEGIAADQGFEEVGRREKTVQRHKIDTLRLWAKGRSTASSSREKLVAEARALSCFSPR